jgi:hypothetical protein
MYAPVSHASCRCVSASHIIVLLVLRTQYDNMAFHVLESAQDRMQRVVSELETLSMTATLLAKTENDTWPFVTLPDFQVRLYYDD